MPEQKKEPIPLVWIVYDPNTKDFEVGGDMKKIQSYYVEGHEIDFTRHITKLLNCFIEYYLVDLIKRQKKVKK
jgi:hypothetical protein